MFPPKILNLPRKKVKSVHARNSAHPKIEDWYSFFFDFDMSWNSITKKHEASEYMQISVIFCILKYSKISLSLILEKHCANSHTINVPNRPQQIYRVASKQVNSSSCHFFWSGFSSLHTSLSFLTTFHSFKIIVECLVVLEWTPKYWSLNTPNIECPNIKLSEHHIFQD